MQFLVIPPDEHLMERELLDIFTLMSWNTNYCSRLFPRHWSPNRVDEVHLLAEVCNNHPWNWSTKYQ